MAHSSKPVNSFVKAIFVIASSVRPMMWPAASGYEPRAIMCCTPTARWLIVLTLPPPLLLSSQPATGPSALAPAQRAGAQRLRAMARSCGWRMSGFPLLLGGKQTFGELPENDAHDPKRKSSSRVRPEFVCYDLLIGRGKL